MLLCFYAFMMLTSVAHAQVSTVIGGHNPWPPYIESDGSGLVNDILFAAFSSQGVALEIQIAPFSRMMLLLENRKVDFVAALWWTEEREKTILFSQPYLHNELFVVSRQNQLVDFRGTKSLRYKSVATIRGYAYRNLLVNIEQLNVIDVLSLHACLELVHKGRADFAIADILAFKHELKHDSMLQNLMTHSPALSSWPLHIGVSREHPDAEKIIQLFNLGLATIKKNGSYQQIIAQYLD
ncbi:hypothetical protein PSECIP111951_03394 [Pseudoalteromonas holothuriae]|uniref:Solute-binding protein family 3/N-terminal domain-containing protein n=2 Tax=Pseudoalteromonas holothuriae TaxID=2963714 RepID=A0ABM9GMA7_9GAMM|nr:hypothetical protein PSECIP111951_03394 [Pseudoalteromonas sp. CIP111951]